MKCPNNRTDLGDPQQTHLASDASSHPRGRYQQDMQQEWEEK